MLVSVGTIGADTGVVRSLPRAIALGQPRDLTATLRTANLVPLLLSLALGLALVVAATPLGALLTGEGEQGSTAFADVLRLLGPFLPIAVIYAIGLAASRGLGSMMPLVGIEKLGRGSTQTAAVGVAVALTTSVVLVTLAWALPFVAALAILVVWTVRRVRAQTARIRRGVPRRA